MATDNFTDTNGTALETHDAKWVNLSSTYPVTNIEIQGNVAQAESAWDQTGALYSDGQPADQSSEAVIPGGSTSMRQKVAARITQNTDFGYAIYFSRITGSDYDRIYILKDNSWAAARTGSFGATADPHTLKIAVSTFGSDALIETWVDSSKQTDWTDTASPLTGGLPGFYASGDSAVAQCSFDDWTDGISAGGALLDAAVSCAGTVAGAITTAVTMAASVAASGVVAAVLTTSIILGSAVNVSATPIAALTTGINLASSVSSTATATTALTTGITLNAAVNAAATQASSLTTQIELRTAVSATAAATGELTVGLNLDAAVTGSAAAGGNLSTQIPLTASIAASSVTAAQLTTAISLVAVINGQAASTGELATDITLSVDATAAASVSGILNAQKIFNVVQLSADFQDAAAKTALFNVTRNNTVLFTRNRTKEVWF